MPISCILSSSLGVRCEQRVISGGRDRKQAPSLRNALERDAAAVFKGEAGPRHEVPHRPRDEHLAGGGLGGHPGADVDGDARHLPVQQLDLAGMQAGTDLEAQRAQGVHDRPRASNRSRRTVKSGKEAVAGRVDLTTVEALQLTTHGDVVLLDDSPPAAVTQFRHLCRGADQDR